MDTHPERKVGTKIIQAIWMTLISFVILSLLFGLQGEIRRSYNNQHKYKNDIEQTIAFIPKMNTLNKSNKPAPPNTGSYNCHNINAAAWDYQFYKCSLADLVKLTLSNSFYKSLSNGTGLIYLAFAPIILLFFINLALQTFFLKKYPNITITGMFGSVLLCNVFLLLLVSLL